MILRLAVLGSSIAALSTSAAADGMPIEGGRFVGGPTTVLSLTPAQSAALGSAEEQGSRKSSF